MISLLKVGISLPVAPMKYFACDFVYEFEI